MRIYVGVHRRYIRGCSCKVKYRGPDTSTVLESQVHDFIRHDILQARNYSLCRALLASRRNPKDAYFSEILSAGDSVVVFEDGPVKFTASCKTVTHDYSYYGYSFTSSSWNGTYSGSSSSSGGSSSYTQTHSSSYYHPLTSTSSSCYDPCKSSSSTEDYSYSFEPDASSGSSSTMMYEPTSSPEDPAEGTVTTMSDGPSVPYDDDAGSSSGDMPAEPADEGEYSTPSPTMSFDPYDYSYTESFVSPSTRAHTRQLYSR